MKRNLKKFILVIVMIGITASQIGCAGKVTKVSEPMDKVQFNKNYSYTIKLKKEKPIEDIPGNQIVCTSDQTVIHSGEDEKKLLNTDIDQILGRNMKATKTKMIPGAATGFVMLGLVGLVVGSIVSIGDICDYRDCFINGGAGFIFGGMAGAIVGGLIGAGNPRYDIQITPIIEPTKEGANAGAKMQVNF
jgi:hypothetical protein